MTSPRWTTSLLAALSLVAVAGAAQAQPKRKIEGELSGNAFFGNTRQMLASVRAEHERVDSAFAFRILSRLNYGQTTTDATGTIVSKRSWNAGSNYDWRPYADFAPFVRASVEGSYENRIARRYSAGMGSRINVRRDSLTDVIFSLGANGERTQALPPGDSLGANTLARGYSGLRLRRELTSRVSFTSESSYEPALTEGGDYTIKTVNAFKVKLARFAGLTFLFRDNYDSKSISRGARTNNDVELLMGILTTF
jgi:hypothetical protein